jgi:hypothetical protein
MDLLLTLTENARIQRVQDLERLQEKGTRIAGDFEGSVTGYWVRLENNGGGTVSYNNKQYLTKPIGFVSLPAGSEVELSYANGIYYSKF